ncbi:MAG TPA: hypothetical protein VED59_07625 [Acidimicrobiales bacterium]|nr:hypothetical protein [Acidimicrobiales bacterium]
MSATLGVPVLQHDDGSHDSMYDLAITLEDGQLGAVEVTAAADPEGIQLTRILHRHELWVEPRLQSAWHVTVLPQARAKNLFARLPDLLEEVAASCSAFINIACFESSHDPWMRRACDLGLESVYRVDNTDHPGAIYISVDGRALGGYVPLTGDPLADWLTTYLADDERKDVRRKLALARCHEQHVFVWLPIFHAATWEAFAVATTKPVPLPTRPPELPSAVSHVWVMSTWGGRDGLRWSPGGGWTVFTDGGPQSEEGLRRRPRE